MTFTHTMRFVPTSQPASWSMIRTILLHRLRAFVAGVDDKDQPGNQNEPSIKRIKSPKAKNTEWTINNSEIIATTYSQQLPSDLLLSGG